LNNDATSAWKIIFEDDVSTAVQQDMAQISVR
jgi:hypothetical protein